MKRALLSAGVQRLSCNAALVLLASVLLAALAGAALTGCSPPAPISAPAFRAEIRELSFEVGQPIVPIVLPQAAGGTGRLTYSLRGKLPPGLTFEAGRREISGTPDAEGTYPVIYEARDENGQTANLGFSITTSVSETVVRLPPLTSVVSTVTVGSSAGVFRPADRPEASGGPAVQVSGETTFAAGATVALEVAPEPGASVAGLLVWLDDTSSGYFEVDVTGAAAPFPLHAQITPNIESEFPAICMSIAAVDTGGAVGPRSACHELQHGAPTPTPGTTVPPPIDDTLTYRGDGDQVFVLNPDWASIDGTVYRVDLGGASAQVHVIATNSSADHADPEITVFGHSAVVPYHDPPPRPSLDALPTMPEELGTSDLPPRLQPQSARAAVMEDDQFTFGNVAATARSVVTDGTITATVWVGDDDWDTGCSGAGPCVTAQMADAMADRFLRTGAGNDVYDWLTALFGVPWGPHAYSNLIPASAAQHIHILLYDIDKDGSPEPGECRVGGSFRAGHSYLNSDPDGNSAERLMFFIDSPLYATPEGDTWEVTDRRPSLMISVLAHEFQHMIHFYQKAVLQNAARNSWLNEMASEVAQDLVADKLMADGPRGVAYSDPTAGASGIERGRLPIYNLFNDISVTRWRGKIANYAIAYALGGYLARTYGAELFQQIVQNDKSGVAAVEAALAELNHAVSFGTVLADWGVANLLSDNTAAPSPYRYNPGTWSTSQAGGETYRLGSINLYHYRFDAQGTIPECYGTDLAARSTQEGPYLHSPHSFSATAQPPHSNRYASLGRRTGTVQFQVRTPADTRITVVVRP